MASDYQPEVEMRDLTSAGKIPNRTRDVRVMNLNAVKLATWPQILCFGSSWTCGVRASNSLGNVFDSCANRICCRDCVQDLLSWLGEKYLSDTVLVYLCSEQKLWYHVMRYDLSQAYVVTLKRSGCQIKKVTQTVCCENIRRKKYSVVFQYN